MIKKIFYVLICLSISSCFSNTLDCSNLSCCRFQELYQTHKVESIVHLAFYYLSKQNAQLLHTPSSPLPLHNLHSQYFTCRLGASPLRRRCCTRGHTVSQPITESLQPADYSVDSTASFSNRQSKTTTQQGTGGSRLRPQPALTWGGGVKASTSEQQHGQNKEPIRIGAGVAGSLFV